MIDHIHTALKMIDAVDKPADKLVLLAIAKRQELEPGSHATIKYIRGYCRFGIRSVSESIRHLNEIGFIKESGVRTGITKRQLSYVLRAD